MKLTVHARSVFGKKVSLLRQEGIIPAVVYGKHLESPVSISINKIEAVKVYKAAGGSTPVEISGDGIDHLVLIQDIQLDPVSDHLLHMDLIAVNRDEKVRTEVPLVLTGESSFEQSNLGRVRLVKDSLELEALPMDLPHDIQVDISSITEDGQVIFAKDLTIPSKVTLIADPELAVVVSAAFREEVEEEEVEETAEGLGEAVEAAEE